MYNQPMRVNQLKSSFQLRRWTTFSIVALAYMLSFFHRTAPGAISNELTIAFNTSSVELGVLGATYYYLYLLLQIPTGVLVDTYGPRKILSVFGVIAGLGSIVFGLSPSLGWAVLGRALVGLGVAVVFVALLKLNSRWFRHKEFATVAGLTVLLGNLGAVL